MKIFRIIYLLYCKNGTKSGEKCIASSIVEVIKSTGTFHLSYSLSVGVKIGLFYIAGYLILYLQGLQVSSNQGSVLRAPTMRGSTVLDSEPQKKIFL